MGVGMDWGHAHPGGPRHRMASTRSQETSGRARWAGAEMAENDCGKRDRARPRSPGSAAEGGAAEGGAAEGGAEEELPLARQ